MLPGMLLHVTCECVLFVNFNILFVIGFGATIMRGALVMRQRGWMRGNLCSAGTSITLCFRKIVLGQGDRWGLSAGRIHLWRGCVCTRVDCARPFAASFSCTKVNTHCCLPGVIAERVAIILSVNPCMCLVYTRQGTWQC
jgi:hypothetical protein